MHKGFTNLLIFLCTFPAVAQTTISPSDVRYLNTYAGSRATTYVRGVATTLVSTNQSTFSTDSSVYYRAAPAYANMFAADFGLAVMAEPKMFSDTAVHNSIVKFLAHTNGSGEIPIAISSDEASVYFYSGADSYHHHATPDGAFMLPILEYEYYSRLRAAGTSNSVALTQFSIDVVKLTAALNALQIDSTTGCPKIVAGDERSSFGFHDGMRPTGAISLDCAFYAHATELISKMYAGTGSPVPAATWLAKSNAAKAGLSTSSALWSSGSGMLLAATGQNNQIDIAASVFARHWGLLSEAQGKAIGTYLANNFSTLTSAGYIRQSPTNWAYMGQLTSSGGAPYGNDTAHPGSDGKGAGTYDDAYWSYFFREFVEAIVPIRPDLAGALIAQFYATPDPTVEFISQTGITTPAVGFTNNLESPLGPLAALEEFPGLNNSVDPSSSAGLPAGISVTPSSGLAGGRMVVIGLDTPPSGFDGEGNIFESSSAGTNITHVYNRVDTTKYAGELYSTGKVLSGGWTQGFVPGDTAWHLYDRVAGRDSIKCVVSGGCTILGGGSAVEHDFTSGGTTFALDITSTLNVVVVFNAASFTVAAGAGGQPMDVAFCNSGGPWTVTPPSNVTGFGTITGVADHCMVAHLVYSTVSTSWYTTGIRQN